MSATGTPTTNLNLRIMNGTDPVDVTDINANSQTLDSRIGAIPSGMNLQGEINAANTNIETLRGGLAIIVDGDTCSVAVPAGGYAYIKNNTHGLAEGLYKNTSGGAFPVSGGSATSSVFTAVPTGLGGEVASLNSNLNSLKNFDGRVIFNASQENSTKTVDLKDKPLGVYMVANSCGKYGFIVKGLQQNTPIYFVCNVDLDVLSVTDGVVSFYGDAWYWVNVIRISV